MSLTENLAKVIKLNKQLNSAIESLEDEIRDTVITIDYSKLFESDVAALKLASTSFGIEHDQIQVNVDSLINKTRAFIKRVEPMLDAFVSNANQIKPDDDYVEQILLGAGIDKESIGKPYESVSKAILAVRDMLGNGDRYSEIDKAQGVSRKWLIDDLQFFFTVHQSGVKQSRAIVEEIVNQAAKDW